MCSAAAANAPLQPPTIPSATILAPRNARASASPIHSRGVSSPVRVAAGNCSACCLFQFSTFLQRPIQSWPRRYTCHPTQRTRRAWAQRLKLVQLLPLHLLHWVAYTDRLYAAGRPRKRRVLNGDDIFALNVICMFLCVSRALERRCRKQCLSFSLMSCYYVSAFSC